MNQTYSSVRITYRLSEYSQNRRVYNVLGTGGDAIAAAIRCLAKDHRLAGCPQSRHVINAEVLP